MMAVTADFVKVIIVTELDRVSLKSEWPCPWSKRQIITYGSIAQERSLDIYFTDLHHNIQFLDQELYP
jgi:hypothetical protein